MNMSPKAKENVIITWRIAALGLLSGILFFLTKLNDKIDYSYEANVKQQIINENIWQRMSIHASEIDRLQVNVATISADVKKLDLDYEKIQDRQFQIQSKTN